MEESTEHDLEDYGEEQTEGRQRRRTPTRSVAPTPRFPVTHELLPDDEEGREWASYEELDPEIDYNEQLERHTDYGAVEPEQSLQPLVRRATQGMPPRSRQLRPAREERYEEAEERRPARKRRRKGTLSRRGLLLGLGAAAVGGAGLAAYELAPKIPGAVGDVSSNIEHQLQDAFNNGMAQGAENVRKEFVTALNNLEGFTLEGAINAARLTRVAYDVFVSPVIQFGSTITSDFLNGMLRAFKTARGWLAGAGQDNATLEAIQKVLESWSSQVTNMPKQLDAITDTDLDGAQAYLRALQRKLDQEKALLNNPQGTPTPATRATPKPTAQPTKHP
jgi:hypothetical protein